MSQAPFGYKPARGEGRGGPRGRPKGGRRAMARFELVTNLWQGLDVSIDRPRVLPVAGRFGYALTVDVEEWYHTCQVPGYVHPECRPVLRTELDRLLPE